MVFLTIVETSGLYPLRLFGWSEIETLGRESHRQRELLDRLIPELSERLKEKDSAKISLFDKRKEIESSLSRLRELLGTNKGEIKSYHEYKTDFEKLNTEDVKNLFVQLDDARIKETILSKIRENIQEWHDDLDKIIKCNILEGVEILIPDEINDLKKWWTEKKSSLKIIDKQSDISNILIKGQNALKEFTEQLKTEIDSLAKEIETKDKEIREKVSEEAAKQVTAELRKRAGERLGRVEKLRQLYFQEFKVFTKLLEEWKEICSSLVGIHDQITGIRAKQKNEIEGNLNQFKTEEMKISLRFEPSGDRVKFGKWLKDEDFFNKDLHGNYKQKQWPEKLSMACTPIEVVQSILKQDSSMLIKTLNIDGKESIPIDEDMATKVITTFYPFTEDTDIDLQVVDEQKLYKILKIAEVEWDDFEGILLNEKPVEHLSPGQRSSAMLPLIALVENTPLVIDQPEDNLDNRLIGKVLVNILAALKEKRQIIVATHNPNIVVSGDAEQVIVLDALSDSEGTCKIQGSIDKDEIITNVIEIMEGGREAFLTRGRRYNLNEQKIK